MGQETSVLIYLIDVNYEVAWLDHFTITALYAILCLVLRQKLAIHWCKTLFPWTYRSGLCNFKQFESLTVQAQSSSRLHAKAWLRFWSLWKGLLSKTERILTSLSFYFNSFPYNAFIGPCRTREIRSYTISREGRGVGVVKLWLNGKKYKGKVKNLEGVKAINL